MVRCAHKNGVTTVFESGCSSFLLNPDAKRGWFLHTLLSGFHSSGRSCGPGGEKRNKRPSVKTRTRVHGVRSFLDRAQKYRGFLLAVVAMGL